MNRHADYHPDREDHFPRKGRSKAIADWLTERGIRVATVVTHGNMAPVVNMARFYKATGARYYRG